MIALILASLLALPAAHREAATLAAVVHAQDPDLLLAIAYVESRWTADVTSKSGRHCGPMQTRARDAKHCALLRRDIRESYREGARIFATWLVVAKGDTRAALRGYGCGFQRGTSRPADRCNGFDRRVLAIRAAIRKQAQS